METPDVLLGIDASRSYAEPMTGTERYSRRIVEQLIRLLPDDHHLRLYFRESPPDHAELGRAEQRVLPARRFWTHHRLRSELKRYPVDLLFVPSHVLPLGYAGKSVVTVHDLGYLHEPDAHTRSSRMQLDLTTRWNARQASHIVAISHATRDDLIKRYGADPDRVTVIHHGIDAGFSPVHPEVLEQFRQRRQLPERFILYLGTVQPRKNLQRLISAFEQIALDDTDVELIIAGKTGWKSGPIVTRATVSGMSGRIRFEGHVPDEELPALYSAASVVALPSLYEGFGLPVLEAMACGTPVVMSNRGALPEIAGADAQIVDPLDVDSITATIRSALDVSDDADRRESRIQHARQFTWETAGKLTADVLTSVYSK
jgi:glycosyltransferase involved in cell wall biosynthesis